MKFLSLLIFFVFNNSIELCSQIYLQIETKNNPKTSKLYQGMLIEYARKDYPKIWRKSEIMGIIPETDLLLMEDNYIKPSDIVALRYDRPVVSGIGKKMMQASAVWFVYGGLATLGIDDYTISTREIVYGVSAASIGYLLRKIFGKRKMKIGNRRRLRIVDIRM